jgi:hypothetical protein
MTEQRTGDYYDEDALTMPWWMALPRSEPVTKASLVLTKRAPENDTSPDCRARETFDSKTALTKADHHYT